MPVTPTGPISLPLANLRTLLANSTSFQSWTESADATEALDRIHLVDLPGPTNASEYTAEELAALRPYAIVDSFDPPGSYGFQPYFKTQVAEPNVFIDFGKLVLTFEDKIAEANANDPASAKIDFMNNVGAVIADMAELAGTDAYLVVRSFEQFTPFTRTDQTKIAAQGDFYRVKIIVHWGQRPRGVEM